MIAFTLYLLYAFLQACMIARYTYDGDKSTILFEVIGLTIVAPIATVYWIGFWIKRGIFWIVIPKNGSERQE